MRFLTLLLGALALASCATLPPAQPSAPWPSVRLVVFTDSHVLAPSLVASEGAMARLEDDSFQVFREGPEILQTMVARLVAERPSAVLLTGDLTKDGERASHEFVATALAPLRAAGIPVLVIPGNHDVWNPHANAYTDEGPRPTAQVSPADFARIYHDDGYGQALSRDPASLSYIAEPVPGLRILALDSVRYEENVGRSRPVTAGRIRDASWPWIDQVLDQAARDHVAVAVMMHHGLVEKFEGQGSLFWEYLVADRHEVARRLAARGVQVVFTGHFHTLSMAEEVAAGRPILDIEGGTTSAYPLGFRRVSTAEGRLKVSTDHVTDLPSWADRPGQFLAKAQAMSQRNIQGRVKGMLRRAGVSPTDAEVLTGRFTLAFGAVASGDPRRPASWEWPPRGLGLMGSLAAAYLGRIPENLWTPTAPDDLVLDAPLPLPVPAPDR